MIGITSFGAYIPRLRLNRMSIYKHMGWFAPATIMVAQGERSMCNWDEDTITMAVTSSKDCLKGVDKNQIDGLFLASTTLPFDDRQNAGVVATALNLPETILTTDMSASQRVATNALITALESVKSGDRKKVLVTAADKRDSKSAYFYEMWFGDGAASLLLGQEKVIAEYLGSYSISSDFVDHYRGAKHTYDYMWEERWVRDEGYSKLIPAAVNGLLEKLEISIEAVDKLVYPCFFKAEHSKIAKQIGVSKDQVVDNLHDICGETGAAHSLLMMVKALETAKPGDRIILAGFGQGCNALYFKVTDEILNLKPRQGVAGSLENKETIENYPKFLKFRNLLDTEMGIRAEAPTQTAMTTLYRKRKMLLGLVGGKCNVCQTPQFPKMDICVNPNCGALKSQEDYEFADIPATIKTFTSDLLAVSVDPPHNYGLIQFEGGGRFMADFTDCKQEDLKVGLPMQMRFRIRTVDKERGFTNYFWKAVPVPGAAQMMDQIQFEGRVAVITGAGGGLGRIYALELAKRGAKVVVNDLGSARDGSGQGSISAADNVVNEIKESGGFAVSDYNNVATPEGGAKIIQTALDTFGRVDILINNAGILRDKSFVKLEPENWQAVLDVHLNGAFNVTRPAFIAMKGNNYGRIIMTTSAAGLYGNFGQVNYAAAKMGLVGMMNTLKHEGAKYNIKVNTVAPLAASRLTEDIMPPDVFKKMKPEYVAPLVLYLSSEKCTQNGQIFNAGMGYYNRVAILTGAAIQLGDKDNLPTPEAIHGKWDQINSMEKAKELNDLNAAVFALISPPEEASQTDTESDEMTVQEIFKKMPEAFNADAAEGLDLVFQYCISGPSGGEWMVTVKDNSCQVEVGKSPNATCTIIMADKDFVRMISGTLNSMQAYTSGKLSIEGDIMKSQLIEKLFTL